MYVCGVLTVYYNNNITPLVCIACTNIITEKLNHDQGPFFVLLAFNKILLQLGHNNNYYVKHITQLSNNTKLRSKIAR